VTLVDSRTDGHVGIIEIVRGPHNFIDASVLAAIVTAGRDLHAAGSRSLLLCSEGKNFCAGADISSGEDPNKHAARHIYDVAVELFELELPIVAAVQGKAVGAGVGLALVADVVVATPQTQFVANFSRLGFSHGFGMTETLVRAVGHSAATELLCTGRAVLGPEALELGLCRHLVEADQLRGEALTLSREFTTSAPLAVQAIRAMLRGDLAGAVARALRRERATQERLMATADFREGVNASGERRAPTFEGR
jgi:2-(1,2-epoxy-1,2-dihydrophenyl)acetyl-CoA isomerase